MSRTSDLFTCKRWSAPSHTTVSLDFAQDRPSGSRIKQLIKYKYNRYLHQLHPASFIYGWHSSLQNLKGLYVRSFAAL